jgi:hypothetical protein
MLGGSALARYAQDPMRRRSAEPWLIAAALALAYLIVRPPSADLAAQIYRTELFERAPFAIWNAQWYGGHHTPGYGVLFPPLASLLGPRLVGALACVAAAALFGALTTERWGADRARVGALWFGVATASNLITGRLTFALGVTVGLAALLALQRGRTRLAIVFAALTPLASPIAGLFLALVGLALARADRRKMGLAIAGVAFGVAIAVSLAFPEGGVEPFATSAWWPTLATAAAIFALAPREETALRTGAVLYAVGCLAAYVLSTPMGGNATRMGSLFGGPLLACALYRRRPAALALLVVPLLYWQWSAPIRDLAAAAGDPSVKEAFYNPLNKWLAAHVAPSTRIEIPMTRNKGEAAHVAETTPLARGWERQLDIKYNGVLYGAGLTGTAYRRWLHHGAVQYVALPAAKLDYSSLNEARLIRAGQSFLREVWHTSNWRVYRVLGSPGLVTGPATLRGSDSQGFTVNVSAPGDVIIRMRWTPYWSITRGRGCVRETPDGFTYLKADAPGIVRVEASFDPTRIVSRGRTCAGGGP